MSIRLLCCFRFLSSSVLISFHISLYKCLCLCMVRIVRATFKYSIVVHSMFRVTCPDLSCTPLQCAGASQHLSLLSFPVSCFSHTFIAVKSLSGYQCIKFWRKQLLKSWKSAPNLLPVNNQLLNFDQLLRLEMSKFSYKSKYTTGLLPERISYMFLSSGHQYRSYTRQRTSPNIRRFNHEIYRRNFVSRDVGCIKFFSSTKRRTKDFLLPTNNV